MNSQKGPFQIEAVIDGAIRIREDREGSLDDSGVALGTFRSVPQNHQNLRPGGLEILVDAPQLGDVRAALYSGILAHEEQCYVSFAVELG